MSSRNAGPWPCYAPGAGPRARAGGARLRPQIEPLCQHDRRQGQGQSPRPRPARDAPPARGPGGAAMA